MVCVSERIKSRIRAEIHLNMLNMSSDTSNVHVYLLSEHDAHCKVSGYSFCSNIGAMSRENLSSGVRVKPIFSSTQRLAREISAIASRGIILSRQRTTKALIR